MQEYRLSSNGALAINSSGGKLLKWKIGNKFVKTSTYNQTQIIPEFMYESYAEVIASRLAHRLGFNCVKYKLCKVIIDDSIETVACESDDFIFSNYQYISIDKLIQLGQLPQLQFGITPYNYRILCQLHKDFKEYIDNTIILDYLILNDDRHFDNFGFLRKGKWLLPPIFDNGNSMFCHKYINGISYNSNLSKLLRAKPFCNDFDKQISLIGKYKLKEISLTGLTSNLIGLPLEREQFIKELLKDRYLRLKSLS